MKIFYYIQKNLFRVELLIVWFAVFIGIYFYACTPSYEEEQFEFPPCLMYQGQMFWISSDLSTIRDGPPDGYTKIGEIKQIVTYPENDWDSNSCPIGSEVYSNVSEPNKIYVHYISDTFQEARFHLYLSEEEKEEEKAYLFPNNINDE